MEKNRILIIEDNPDTRRFLEAMLGKEFEILTAENGVIGIDFARNKSPDLILLDIMLPILSGYDACRLLKKDEKTKHIPIIFLSAKNSVPDITHGLTAGADDYIPKPFDYKELVARIKARLRKTTETAAQPIQVGDLRIDPANREVTFAGKKAQLTLTEFDILRYLAVARGRGRLARGDPEGSLARGLRQDERPYDRRAYPRAPAQNPAAHQAHHFDLRRRLPL